MTPAAIWLHITDDVPRDKQEALALAYCVSHGLTATTLVFHPQDALRLLQDSTVEVVVCAYLPRDRDDVSELAAVAGARLRQVRATARSPVRESGTLMARMYDRGMSVAEIAELMDVSTGEIRAQLIQRHRPI